MRAQVKKWSKRAGYVGFYFGCFALAASLLFPYEILRERIVADFNAQQRVTGAQQELSIDHLGWYWFTGVRAKGIKLASAPTPPSLEPAEIHIDEARIALSLSSKLVGTTRVVFEVDALGGHIKGHFSESGSERSVEKPNGQKEVTHKDREVELSLDSVDLRQVDALTQLIGLPLEGRISGQIRLFMPEGHASKGAGSVDLAGQDVAIGDGKAKLKGALDWPKLTVGAFSFVAEAKEGALKISKFGASGKDLDLNGEGKVQMRDLANDSVLDMSLKFKVNDSYRGKSPLTTALFGAPGTAKGGDVEMVVPQMRQAKRPDGFYGFHLRGLLARLDFEPQPSGGVGGAPAGPGSGPARSGGFQP